MPPASPAPSPRPAPKKASKPPLAFEVSPDPPNQPQGSSPPRRPNASGKPNFVVILVDDQDYLLNSTHRAYMPRLHQYIGDQGLHLRQFIVTTSVCCPSRTSLLTGMLVHNHNVTANQAPQGSFSKFEQLQLDRNWLPGWLKSLNYTTYFTGKFVNGFDVRPGETSRCPRGWDMFDPLTDKTVYDYTDFDFLPNCAKTDTYRDNYQTDIMSTRATDYIEDAVNRGGPFYLQINPAACHTACPSGGEEGKCVNPTPAPRHKGLFNNTPVPKNANWGVPLPPDLDISGDNDLQPKGIDRHYQARLETMLATDEMIEAVVQRLDKLGVLEDTYVMYVSDNGYHLGNHGLAKGKYMPYEEDIRVPFYIRGPGIAPGVVSDYMATMVDLTATFVTLGGGQLAANADGIPLPLDRISAGGAGAGRYPQFPKTVGPLQNMLPAELWANSFDNRIDRKNYRSVRACLNSTALLDAGAPVTACWKYTVWCVWPSVSNYRELFDLAADPYELNNLAGRVAGNATLSRIASRMDAMLQAKGLCKARTCRDPWSIIHPGGAVTSLEQALDPRYDAWYAQYAQFTFRACTKYYDPVNNEVTDPWLGGLSRWGPKRTTPQPIS